MTAALLFVIQIAGVAQNAEQQPFFLDGNSSISVGQR